MSLANTAVVGAIWSVASRLGARVVGLVGTLVITRFLAPEVMGEVGLAVVVALTANYLSNLAFGQYVVVKTKDDPAAVFHAFFYNLVLVVIASGLLLILAAPLGDLLGAPEMTRFLPVAVLALVFERLSRIPESMALRDLRFKLFSIVTAVTEISYVVVSLTMAAAGYGGDSIVWANVAQYGLRFAWFGIAVGPTTWMQPVKLRWDKTKEMIRFGLPLAIGNVADEGLRDWDRIIVTGLFGTRIHGIFALGKRLGAVPADNVGDAIADVLMPSLVRMTTEEARVAVVRATHAVAIIVFPLAAGLGVVSPTLVEALFTAEWQEIAMPLTILASLSLIDPMGDNMTAYLQARDKTWAVMGVQLSYLAVFLLSTLILGYFFGLAGACCGVGVGMFYRALSSLYVAHRYDGVSMTHMLGGLTRVALASGVMAIAVLGIRHLLTGELANIYLALAIEITVGGLAYVPAAFLIARPIAMELVQWVRDRRSGAHDEDEDEDDDDDE